MGIRAEDMPRVFELFFTSKPGGSGLGLPMARKIVEKHGGRLELASALGQGTTVRLMFPCLEPGAVDAAGHLSSPLSPDEKEVEG